MQLRLAPSAAPAAPVHLAGHSGKARRLGSWHACRIQGFGADVRTVGNWSNQVLRGRLYRPMSAALHGYLSDGNGRFPQSFQDYILTDPQLMDPDRIRPPRLQEDLRG